ncbi:hypothetical protein MHBO_004583, partial [Bonamia ostreae]
MKRTSMNSDLPIDFGKKLYSMLFTYSRKDPIITKTTEWLIKTAHENSNRQKEEKKENENLSIENIIDFILTQLEKYAGAYAQKPLLFIAHFLDKKNILTID